jgi:hypothetical protein
MKLGQVIKKGSGDREDLQSPGKNSNHHPLSTAGRFGGRFQGPYDNDAWASPAQSPFSPAKEIAREQVGSRKQMGLHDKRTVFLL